ncbi:MAG: hypothetical protein ATN36_06140 [Epulopiscium sp. Nele67-Bin005]|nr:MAG: hypothetical protein ATN36_06140 [Epulopiscium sp. Nele67-Bin005]
MKKFVVATLALMMCIPTTFAQDLSPSQEVAQVQTTEDYEISTICNGTFKVTALTASLREWHGLHGRIIATYNQGEELSLIIENYVYNDGFLWHKVSDDNGNSGYIMATSGIAMQ